MPFLAQVLASDRCRQFGVGLGKAQKTMEHGMAWK
jgi:hypothetical protein